MVEKGLRRGSGLVRTCGAGTPSTRASLGLYPSPRSGSTIVRAGLLETERFHGEYFGSSLAI